MVSSDIPYILCFSMETAHEGKTLVWLYSGFWILFPSVISVFSVVSIFFLSESLRDRGVAC